ncbi:MAG: hypothetical protein EZS28_011190 [Streblomastix strix]|uniref:Uncharacterized protein n=1 Tax=Streblomastix strix TaxID=222440 RepID=A0A5J4WEE4_9EUKA|nr:MAG: hypothetical protein EZS28_011190 [Streblomastix strix]
MLKQLQRRLIQIDEILPTFTTKEPVQPTPEIEPPRDRFTIVMKTQLSNMFQLFTKKKTPDQLSLQEAVLAIQAAGFVFCATDVYKLNKEINESIEIVHLDEIIKIISTIPLADDEEIEASFDVVEPIEGEVANVDLEKFKCMILSEGEKFTQAEYDDLIKEIEPRRPPEDPKKKKKKKKKKPASAESNEFDSK